MRAGPDSGASPYTVRRIGPGRADEYRAIRLEALATEPEMFGSVFAAEAARPSIHFVERVQSSVVLGAYAEGAIVGMVGLKQEAGLKDAHKAFVWGFFVRPAWRRRGIGSALVAALAEAGRPLVEQLTLTVVRHNAAAIALYQRHGFTVYGIEPKSLKDAMGYADEVLMVRFLDAGGVPGLADDVAWKGEDSA